MNVDKQELYMNYKDYLRIKKENVEEKIEEDIPSPLKSEDKEERKRIKKLLRSSMYQNSENVKLQKEGKKFFWTIKLNSFLAKFSSKNYYLKYLLYKQNLSQKIEVYIGNYLFLNGVHVWPKELYLKTFDERFFKVQFISHKNFESKEDYIAEQKKHYLKQKNELTNTDIERQQFPFIF